MSILAVVIAALGTAVRPAEGSAYTYKITTKGAITVDVRVFRRTVASTYADRRGWTRAGISFRRVGATSRSDFTLVLAAADQMTRFSSICSPLYSCRAGRYVIINQNRWRYGVRHWAATLLAYRKMVLNHETGHWLGLGHRYCRADRSLAPVMQQQSISLQGCRPNPWPRAGEVQAVAFATVLGGSDFAWWE
ncbi:MAG: DUF3152 domain-containing protein [Actinomycetota bacterium]|nr:DUF3152 domain-containing protein [Actinomycetota bacterium]